MLKQKMYYDKILFTLENLEEDRIANHVNTFRTLIDNLARTGTNISGNESAIVLLGSLPLSYEKLVVFISDQPNLTLEDIISLFL